MTVGNPITTEVHNDELQVTYGCELEWSDIDRRIDIPEELGAWEGMKMCGYHMGAEIDIVNTKGQWRGVGTDPLCVTCPVGGEINTTPSATIYTQLVRIMKIMCLFPSIGTSCVNHGHIHVRIPGLKTNLQTLKNVFAYLENNEEDIIRACCGFDKDEHDTIMNSDLQDWVKRYLIIGDGKHINPELYRAIGQSNTIEEALYWIAKIPCCDWDCVTDEFFDTQSSHRTAVNMFNLTKGDTIEFRIFRSSLNPVEIHSCLKFVENVVHQAVLGEQGTSVKELLSLNHYEFPKLNFNYDLARGWQDTRQTKGRCGPFKRSFNSNTVVSEDPVIEHITLTASLDDVSDSDKGLLSIIQICEASLFNEDLNTIRELNNNTKS